MTDKSETKGVIPNLTMAGRAREATGAVQKARDAVTTAGGWMRRLGG